MDKRGKLANPMASQTQISWFVKSPKAVCKYEYGVVQHNSVPDIAGAFILAKCVGVKSTYTWVSNTRVQFMGLDADQLVNVSE